MSMVCYNGALLPENEVWISPFDHGFLYGDGIYETLLFRNQIFFDVSEHLNRLRKSAETLRIPVPWNDTDIRRWLEEVVTQNALSEARVRISITRGANDFHFSGAKSPTLLITASRLMDYCSLQQTGVSLTALPEIHRILPEAKTISLLPLILAKQKMEDEKAFECLFVRENIVTEGSVSNVLCRKEKEIWITPRHLALPGTMQKRVVDFLRVSGKSVQECSFSLEDLQNADEVLLTNSLFGILPVKSICGISIPSCPGELFQELSKMMKNIGIM